MEEKTKTKTKKWFKYILIAIGIVTAFVWLNNLAVMLTEAYNPAITFFLLLIIIALLFRIIYKTKETTELEFQNIQKNTKTQEEAEDLNIAVEEIGTELKKVIELIDVIGEETENQEAIEDMKERLEEIKKWLRGIRKETTEKIKSFEYDPYQ